MSDYSNVVILPWYCGYVAAVPALLSTFKKTKKKPSRAAKLDPGGRSQASEDGSEIQLRFSVREPQLSLCKMNISCIIR